jgi:DNA-binding response OmpR family regulator
MKNILVVSHDPILRSTRVALLKAAGYEAEAAEDDNDALARIELAQFDVVLVGRRSDLSQKGIDQRLREKDSDILILMLERENENPSVFASRTTDPHPRLLLDALDAMLGEKL